MAKRKKEKVKIEYPQTFEEKMARFKILARAQNKKAGEAVVTYGSDLVQTTKTPTGVPEIDDMLGGGIPNGRIITIWGGKGCGKTTLALEYVARCQKKKKLCYYIALEKLDVERMDELGVNRKELMIGQFSKAEQCLDSIIEHAQAQSVDVIILDSIHSLSPTGEQEDKTGKKKSMDKDTMGLLARKLSEFFRKSNHFLAKGEITLFLIGQTRIDLGSFAKLEKLSGGNALLQYSKLILHMRHGQSKNAPKEQCEDDNGDGYTKILGFEAVVIIDKTQIAGTKNERTEVRFPFFYNGGFFEKKEIKNTKIMEADGIKKTPIEANQGEEVELGNIKPKKKRGRPAKKEMNYAVQK